jgi:hypothetical protein
MRPRSAMLADKSLASMLSAIEVYNKPDFRFREEVFTILATNAWELLLKARVLQLAGNKMPSILRYEKRRIQDGSMSKKLYQVKNRSGNCCTINLFKAFDILVNDYGDSIPNVVRDNIEAVVEVRDNAVHFMNAELALAKKVHEIGTATIKNYIYLARKWFAIDFGQFDIFLMPLGFLRMSGRATAVAGASEEQRLLRYIADTQTQHDDHEDDDCNFILGVDIRFRRSEPGVGVSEVRLSDSPDALPVTMTEEDVRAQFPWDYQILTTRLRKRYSDFKANQDYHDIRAPLEKSPKLCKKRFLDPGNPKSSVKKFYSPNIVKCFDEHYTKQ